MQNKLVFVYGTLRQHQTNAHLLAGATCMARQCWTKGRMFDSGYGYPYLISAEGRAYGELYGVTDIQLKALDRLEGYHGENQDNYYNRVQQTIYTNQGKYEAYVYLLANQNQVNNKNEIEGGDWSVYMLLKQNKFMYFAYGSCMDHERFIRAGVNQWFQQIKGRGILNGYRLRFTRKAANGGRADIVEEGGIVEGKVYELPMESLDYLYRREGVKAGCYRPTVVDITVNGLLLKNVLTFTVVEKEAETAPPSEYVNEIFRGATGLVSEQYLEELKQQLQERFKLSF